MDFIIIGIIFTIFMGIFLGLLLIGGVPEPKEIKAWILLVILALVIGFGTAKLLFIEIEHDRKLWNNGYCSTCHNKLEFNGADKNINSSILYFWSCDNCQRVIQLRHNFN